MVLRPGGTPVGEVAGVQELQELQNEKIGIVPRALFEAGVFFGKGKLVRLSRWTEGLPRRGYRTQPRVSTLGTFKIDGSALKGREMRLPNKSRTDGPAKVEPSSQILTQNKGSAASRHPALCRPFRTDALIL
jgi:hypothetical protein